MKQSDNDVSGFLGEYPAAVSDLARRLRAIVRAAIPGAREELGVVHGARLPDPQGLPEGSGKQHRYVAFSKPADLEKAGLKELLRTAVTAWQERSMQSA